MFSKKTTLAEADADLAAAIARENTRQEDHIELIASENYVSMPVMLAQGSQLTNKYAEGYPGNRYYGGCEYVDEVEQLAQDRLKKLFGAAYVNVQPHSGSQANQAVYTSVLTAGDTILGMGLDDGGHLTHGAKVNLSGKLYKAFSYGLDADEKINYGEVEELALKHRPKMIVAGASAYSLTIDWARFRAIADKIGAYLFVDMAHYAGLIAAGEYPNPLPFADFVTTTTHKTLRGPRGGAILTRDTVYEKKLNSAVFPGLQGGPLMHVIAAKAVCFKEALTPEFKDYARRIKKNALVLAQTLQQRGLRIISGTTESHLFLIDLRPKKITGIKATALLGQAHITVNKNAIPHDPEKPAITSGIRLGTAAITTRGFNEEDTVILGNLIADVLEANDNTVKLNAVAVKVRELCRKRPVYG